MRSAAVGPEQHGELEAGLRHPGAGVESLVDAEREREVVLGVGGTVERRAQHTGPVGVGAHEAHGGTVDGAGVSDRRELCEDCLGESPVIERHRSRRELTNEHTPQV